MQVRWMQNGSFGQSPDELVPGMRLDLATGEPRPNEPDEVDVKLIGTSAYLINQYLFESSRH